MKLSVVMPIYNERATLREVVAKVLSAPVFAVPMEIELICVDDGSEDGSRDVLAALQSEHPQIRQFFSRAIWARVRRCAAAFRKRPATT